ncbi:FAD binding domain-domain-containing protein [Syncephalastrum racemosum]|uniref:FAD binding domain-domain-containing protein n=1 Tax=Syncephalastrum racemosum TaxID=13706 RepID=A0A1X2HW03_SYNRA|nr:FAD binding domain-domain-containing protein [Syncephalastrum racemosum]
MPVHALQQSDVLIVGAGSSGLYAALLLTSMGVSVRILDKGVESAAAEHPMDLLSPNTLQLLHTFDLVRELEKSDSTRHWRFQTYTNHGTGSNAASVERQSYRVWENKRAEFNYGMSCSTQNLRHVLRECLRKKYDIQVDYRHQLLGVQTMVSHHAFDQPYACVATIKDLATQHATCWRSRVIIGADGSQSFLRQHLGIAHLKRPVSPNCSPCYTVQVSVETDFPGVKTISTVHKDNDRILLLGHKCQLHILLEEKPEWDRLARYDNDTELLTAIQNNIKQILQPYSISFNKVHGYRRSRGEITMAETYSVDRRYFFIGGAAQSIDTLSELMSSNIGFDQAHNLCWKLYLYLNQQAPSFLLDSYDVEMRAHADEYYDVALSFVDLLSNNGKDPVQALKRNKCWMIGGGAALPETAVANNSQCCIPAANTKLKPYTALQLSSTMSEQQIGGKTSNCSAQKPKASRSLSASDTHDDKKSKSLGSVLSWRNRTQSASSLHSLEKETVKKSNQQSETQRHQQQEQGGWTKAMGKIKTKGYQHYDSKSLVIATHAERWKHIKANQYHLFERIAADRPHPGAFTVLVFCGSLANCDNLHALQRFKRYLDSPSSLMQYEHSHHVSSLSSPSPDQLSSPLTPQSPQSPRHPPPTRNSISSWRSSASSHRFSRFIPSVFTTWSSSSASTVSDNGPMTPVSISSSGSNSHRKSKGHSGSSYFKFPPEDLPPPPLPLTATPSSLFSFVYITTSNRHEVNDFVASTAPMSIHAAFPFGLERVYLDHDNQTHIAYNANEQQGPVVAILRPDGYIGARARVHDQMHDLTSYFDRFLTPPVDLDSAAADVAADFC